jgi:hypothetical protein
MRFDVQSEVSFPCSLYMLSFDVWAARRASAGAACKVLV